MRYNIGQFILVNKTKEIKEISDKETIENVEIYYTTDNKSYSFYEISEYQKIEPKFTKEEISDGYKNFITQICKLNKLQ